MYTSIKTVHRLRLVLPVICSAVILLGGCGGGGTSANSGSPKLAADDVPKDAIWVDSTEDQVDATPGDLLCESADGLCTLRAAIMEANASEFNAASERHTIMVPPGIYALTLPNPLTAEDLGLGDASSRPIIEGESTGALTLTVPMSIHGAGARETIVDAKQLDRVFTVDQDADATITDMTITGGESGSFSGGIYSRAALRVARVSITGNIGSGGGGIFVNPFGSLEMNDSTVSHNIATGQAGGIRIDTRGTITNSTISYNEALGTAPPVAEGTGVPFFFAQGGGVDVRGFNVIIRNSTIVFNRAAAGGAGIHFDTAYADALPDPITGEIDVPLFDLILENTIIANNSSDVADSDCLTTVGVSRILSQGNNLDSDGSCYLNEPSDQSSVDPLLGELADNGGQTDTHALLPSSTARGAGALSTCTAQDQRGVERGSDGACDIGAFEVDL